MSLKRVYAGGRREFAFTFHAATPTQVAAGKGGGIAIPRVTGVGRG